MRRGPVGQALAAWGGVAVARVVAPLSLASQIARRLRDDEAVTQLVGLGVGR